MRHACLAFMLVGDDGLGHVSRLIAGLQSKKALVNGALPFDDKLLETLLTTSDI
jgi:hypothetical protein